MGLGVAVPHGAHSPSANRSPLTGCGALAGLPAVPRVTLRPSAEAICAAKRALPKAVLPWVARRILSTRPGSSSRRKTARQALWRASSSRPRER